MVNLKLIGVHWVTAGLNTTTQMASGEYMRLKTSTGVTLGVLTKSSHPAYDKGRTVYFAHVRGRTGSPGYSDERTAMRDVESTLGVK